jgi:hypothetical protein
MARLPIAEDRLERTVTAFQSYPFNVGTTVHYERRYDDKFDIADVDFFQLLDSKFVEPAEVISPDQTFRIIEANSQLSLGACP